MKRSEINALQSEAVRFFKKHSFYLPPWAYWSRDDWIRNADAVSEIVESKLGWDLTDFGLGDFYKTGLLLFTIRNGKADDPHGKNYAEKIMIVREEQITPWHFHWNKTEDIINRGGGNLVLELATATDDGKLANTLVLVSTDGIHRTVDAGGKLILRPGESITLPPYLYHTFYGEKGTGTVLVGEVSKVNDDDTDNRFLEPVGRFPVIKEDEPVLYYLCNEYPI